MYLRTLLNTTLSILLAVTLGGCINSSTNNPDQPSTMPPPETPTTPTPSTATSKTLPLTGFKAITAGRNHGCIIKNSDDTLWCWGEGSSGQLGTNNSADVSSFKAINSSYLWQNVSGGYTHTCGVALHKIPDPADPTHTIQLNRLLCWGDNSVGAVGYGTTVVAYYEPMAVRDDDWSTVSAGNNHSCAIRLDKTLWCWGDNTNNQLGYATPPPTPPATKSVSLLPSQVFIVAPTVGSDTDWSSVSASDQFTCALKGDQSLWCWGINDKSQFGIDTAITPKSATPWQIQPTVTFGGSPTILSTWKSITTGQAHGCGIVSSNNLALNDTLWCWGDNSYGQIGNGTTTTQTTPSQIKADSIATTVPTTWSAVAAGHQHTCAIALARDIKNLPLPDDGSLWCWGNNETGQLGINSTAHQTRPVKISHEKGWLTVTTGESHTCAVDKDEIVHCWGFNSHGQLANGFYTDSGQPRTLDMSTDWNNIDSGIRHSCGLKGSSAPYALWCSGFNSYGQLGIGSTSNQSTLVQISANNGAVIKDWKSIGLGLNHSCAIAVDGTNYSLFCWGNNSRGQLGNNAILNNTPNYWWPNSNSQVVVGIEDWSMVVAGANNSCGIKGLNELWCWGDNGTGQISSPPDGSVHVPTRIDGSWRTVTVGGPEGSGGHICGIQTNGKLHCWGKNDAMQLGYDNTVAPADPTAPYKVNDDTNWVSVKAGESHTCALKSDNTLWCWGDNGRGQTGAPVVGTSYPTTVTAPTKESTNGTWLDFDVGSNFTCAIKADHTLWCWGDNLYKQLTTSVIEESYFVPKMVQGTVQGTAEWRWRQLALGQRHGCGIREDSATLERYTSCWGEGAQYQFGDGSAWKSAPQPLSFN